MKSSLHDSSSRMAWSRNGSCRNEGMFLAHFTDMNSSRAAVSNTFSEGVATVYRFCPNMEMGVWMERGVICCCGRLAVKGVGWPGWGVVVRREFVVLVGVVSELGGDVLPARRT